MGWTARSQRTRGLLVALGLVLTAFAAAATPEVEPNDLVPQSLGALALEGATTWSVDGTSGYAGDIDWYAFIVPSARVVRLAVDAPAAWQIVLYSEALQPISSGTGSLTLRLAAGGYRVRIQPSELGTGTYLLLVSDALERESNDGLNQATPLGTVQTEPLTVFASIDPAGDVDFFSFDVPEPADAVAGTSRVLRIETPSPSGDTLLLVYADVDGGAYPVPVARNDDWDGGSWSRLYLQDPAPGRYTLRVHEYADNEVIVGYRVVVTPMTLADSEPNDPPLSAPLGVLSPGGRLERTEFLGQGDVDAFRFEVSAPLCVTVETGGPSRGDSVLTLVDVADRDRPITDDDGGEDGWSRLFRRLDAGYYEVSVFGSSETDTFIYTLSVTTTACPSAVSETEPNDDVATANEVTLPSEISAEIAPDDPDCYRFELLASTRLFAETFGEEDVDTVLCLLDASGTVIACDDDGGDRLWSRLESALDPGIYFVRVELFGGTATAPYRLLLRSDPAAEGEG